MNDHPKSKGGNFCSGELNGRTKGIGRKGRRNPTLLDLSDRNFEGDTPEIGCVVGLKSKKMGKEVQFDTFQDKVSDYILKEFKNTMDILPFNKNMKDPTQNFVDQHLPTNLMEDEADNPVTKGKHLSVVMEFEKKAN